LLTASPATTHPINTTSDLAHAPSLGAFDAVVTNGVNREVYLALIAQELESALRLEPQTAQEISEINVSAPSLDKVSVAATAAIRSNVYLTPEEIAHAVGQANHTVASTNGYFGRRLEGRSQSAETTPDEAEQNQLSANTAGQTNASETNGNRTEIVSRLEASTNPPDSVSLDTAFLPTFPTEEQGIISSGQILASQTQEDPRAPQSRLRQDDQLKYQYRENQESVLEEQARLLLTQSLTRNASSENTFPQSSLDSSQKIDSHQTLTTEKIISLDLTGGQQELNSYEGQAQFGNADTGVNALSNPTSLISLNIDPSKDEGRGIKANPGEMPSLSEERFPSGLKFRNDHLSSQQQAA
jgi:hypothetical protein